MGTEENHIRVRGGAQLGPSSLRSQGGHIFSIGAHLWVTSCKLGSEIL